MAAVHLLLRLRRRKDLRAARGVRRLVPGLAQARAEEKGGVEEEADGGEEEEGGRSHGGNGWRWKDRRWSVGGAGNGAGVSTAVVR